jgi:leucyl-tRNA synthetase
MLVNEMEKTENISVKDFKMFLQILAPFAPHITEELWFSLGEEKTIHLSGWPKYNKKLVIDENIKMAVQVNGKVRAEVSLNKDAKEEDVKQIVLSMKELNSWLEGKEIKRFIYVKGRIINIVV